MLYVAQLWTGSTSLDRMRALRDLGAEIRPFDVTPYRSDLRLVNSLAHRLNSGPPVSRLDRDLRRLAASLDEPLDALLVDKGVWIRPRFVRALTERTGALAVHVTPDPAILFHRSRHFLRALPLYDLAVTTKPWEVDHYRRLGARRVLLIHQAFERSRFFPRSPDPSLACDVAFIGHFEADHVPLVRAAAETGAQVRVWGRGWTRYAARNAWAGSVVQGEGIWDEAYARALSSARIALGLLSKWIPETSTTRTFEIPASGTFLLAERTREHLDFFTEGHEAEYFDSAEELSRKIRHYLAHEPERARIAAGGRERCLRSGYSNHETMALVLREMRALRPQARA